MASLINKLRATARPMSSVLSRYTALSICRNGSSGGPVTVNTDNKDEVVEKASKAYQERDQKEVRTSIDSQYKDAAPLPATYPFELGAISGDQRHEILEEMRGSLDPYDALIKKQEVFGNLGERETPILVPSTSGERLIGCVCEEDADEVRWMVLYDGEKKRCACGHWFQILMTEGAHDH